MVFGQGDALWAVWYVVSGTVKLTHTDGDGRESIVGLALAADWLGAPPVIADRPTPVSAITCAPTLLASCPATTFRQQLRENAELSGEIQRAQAMELLRQATRIGQLCSFDSYARLRAALYSFATVGSASASAGRSIRLDLPIQRWELAQFIGVTPEHLSRLFRDVEDEGLIHRKKGRIIVDDLNRLRPSTDACT